jgi:transcription initiation factor TFIIE subunit alpha
MAKKKITSYELVDEYLTLIAGKDATNVVKVFEKKNKAISDEIIEKNIEKKTPLKITEIRTILNQLHYRGVVCYQKSKNKKTGWYSYTWEMKPDRIAEQIIEKKTEEISKLRKKIEIEATHTMFGCKANCDTYPFEVAAEYYFNCPICGKPLEATNQEKEKKKNAKRIKKMEQELKELEKYMDKTQNIGQNSPC